MDVIIGLFIAYTSMLELCFWRNAYAKFRSLYDLYDGVGVNGRKR